MSHSIEHHHPELKQLINILQPVTSGVAKRWEMFKEWLERQPDASWSQLIQVLIDIGMKTLADKVRTTLKQNIFVSQSTKSTCSVIKIPCEASVEFGVLLGEILELLKKNERTNLDIVKSICSNLTIKDDTDMLYFNAEQLKTIEAYSDIVALFRQQFRYYWRWDDCTFLTIVVSKLKEGMTCIEMIQMYKKKLCSNLKLCHIYEQCRQEGCDVPDGYSKMVAIIKTKTYSDITLKEYEELKEFISKHCGVESYVLCPFCKAGSHSLILEWYIPSTAVKHMVDIATKNT
ncbi:uncharacterized protein [Dysidea avara]|uniref:uncharacterized protein isoform X2 n=1 Tax=Dysidea avara TaxID=196820 RepID=UPI00332ADF90